MLKERMIIGVLFLVTAVLMLTVARCGSSGYVPPNDNAHILRPGQSPAAGPATAGTLYAGNLMVLPQVGRSGSLGVYSGRTVVGTDLEVLSVPADEGFWVGPAGNRSRVWVQLTGGRSESPYDVDRSDHVSFTGRLVENKAGFARSVGVTDREGRDLLEAEGQHVAVAQADLRLAS